MDKPPANAEFTNKLESHPKWHQLTDIQKRICLVHWLNPGLTKPQVAKEAECGVNTVYKFMRTPIYAEIALDMDRYELKELRQLALNAARDELQNGKGASRVNLLVRILESETILRKNPEEKKQDAPESVEWES